MDLIDRYVQRVGFFLPRPQRDDIARELAADLRSEVQEREAALGRSLDADETSSILRRWGHPILVSGRYQPERYLIGPALFPVYRFVLKLVALCYLLPWLVVWAGIMILSPSYRSAHQGAAFLQPLGTWWSLVIAAVGITTLVFAVLERSQARLFERWDPQRLPTVADKNAIPRFTSIVEVVAGTLFILWWTGHLHFPFVANLQDRLELTFTPSFAAFFWLVLAQSAANVLLWCVNLLRPWWTIPRALVRLATNLALVAIAALMLQSGPWVEVRYVNHPGPAADDLARLANVGVRWLLLGIGVTGLLVAVFDDGRRLRRLFTSERTR
jgi:hypothetical protein